MKIVDLRNRDEKATSYFVEEANNAILLKHHNIVRTHTFVVRLFKDNVCALSNLMYRKLSPVALGDVHQSVGKVPLSLICLVACLAGDPEERKRRKLNDLCRCTGR